MFLPSYEAEYHVYFGDDYYAVDEATEDDDVF